MVKCLFCEKEVPQKDGKRARLFCNGNCRNKHYYKISAANKPKKAVGRPKIKVGDKMGKTTVTSVVHFKDQTVVAAQLNNPIDYNIQAQIDKLTLEMNAIVGDSQLAQTLKNKIRNKISILKRQQ